MENKYNEQNQSGSDYNYGTSQGASEYNYGTNQGTSGYEYGTQPEGGQQPNPDTRYEYAQSYEPQKTVKTGENTWMAIVSLILGIVSIFTFYAGIGLVAAIVAIVLGALYMSKKQPQRRGMAIAGLVLGIIAIVLFVIIVVVIAALFVGGTMELFGVTTLY